MTPTRRGRGGGEHYSLENAFPRDDLGPASPADQRMFRPYLQFGAIPQPLRPKVVAIRGAFEPGSTLLIGGQLPDERWLILRVKAPPARPCIPPGSCSPSSS